MATKKTATKRAPKVSAQFSTPENVNENLKGRALFYDTETTGFDPDDGDRMIEIAIVEVVDGQKTGKFIHCYFNPEGKEVGDSIDVHGLSDDFLLDKPLFAEMANDILEFIKDATIIAHNDSFDIKFLNAELERAGFEEKVENVAKKTIDSIKIARRTMSSRIAQFNLENLAKQLGVDLSKRAKHGALIDTEILADVYDRMTFGVDLNKPLPNEDIERSAVNYIQARNRTPVLVSVPENALQSHEEYINGLKNPVERRPKETPPAPTPSALKRGP